ncbi:hypothetical protein H632_c1918p1 [Helicosporidium sp. ATCC 50920]|nr:hypothetical protein H632_c1918p1 [Helicosporidium sp. ATCC 50920]|eukprot:KDD73699.1 hypothetical protein H632_c1918p1 [Helicosporidium sp. ATCC 50920]
MASTGKKLIHWDSKTCPFAQSRPIASYKLPSLTHPDTYAKLHPDPDAPAKVPILEDTDGTLLTESLVVTEYLNDKYPEPPLLDNTPASRAKGRMFVEFFNSSYAPAVFGLLRAGSAEEASTKKDEFLKAIKTTGVALDRLAAKQGGNFFAGDRFTMSDIATVTIVHRSVVALKHYRGIDVWEHVERGGFARMKAWMEAALARPSVQQTCPSNEETIKSMKKFITYEGHP